MEIVGSVILALSCLLLFGVGAMRLFNPIKTYAKNSGIQLDDHVDLLNEIRGVSALMMCSGLIILLGTLMADLRYSSHLVATLVFLGFAIGRIIAVLKDGKPNKQIIQGLVSELVLGAANLFCLL